MAPATPEDAIQKQSVVRVKADAAEGYIRMDGCADAWVDE